MSGHSSPSVIFVLGGPGSGKGTQCQKLVEAAGFKHISAGDCLREERQNPNSKYGALIDHHIREGTIVPVEVTCALLKQKMRQLGWEKSKFLIDGFPRNQNNLQGWLQECSDIPIDKCIVFDCSEDTMRKRLLGRTTEVTRVDDNSDVIPKRFRTYKEETMPIISHFESLGKCLRIDAERSIDDIFQDLKKQLI